jgi:hypothetical protein
MTRPSSHIDGRRRASAAGETEELGSPRIPVGLNCLEELPRKHATHSLKRAVASIVASSASRQG